MKSKEFLRWNERGERLRMTNSSDKYLKITIENGPYTCSMNIDKNDIPELISALETYQNKEL